MANIEWCERYMNQQLNDNRWFNEPINTFSNIVYLISVYKTRNMSHNFLSLYSSLLMVLTCFGSICFHGSGTRIGQLLDEIPIVLLCDSYIKLLDTNEGFSRNRLYEYYIALLTIIYIITNQYMIFLTVVTSQGVALAYFVLEKNIKYKKKAYNRAFMVFIFGKVLWEYERYLYRNNECPQEGILIYLHGGWHVSTAVMHYYIIEGTTTY
jgi:hypothetical protein